MNRDRARELLPILQAFAEGKEIEWRHNRSGWMHDPNPNFSWAEEWRIKPEPREWWVYPGGDKDDSASYLHELDGDCEIFGCIKVREVIE